MNTLGFEVTKICITFKSNKIFLEFQIVTKVLRKFVYFITNILGCHQQPKILQFKKERQ